MQKTDEELVARATTGDADSFDELVRRWERPIFALAYRVLGSEDDALDVCQETFLRAFRGIKGFKGQAKFSSWLYRIALNLCRDWMRRERRSGTVMPLDAANEPPQSPEPVETAEDRTVRRDLGRIMTEAMAVLSDEQRHAVVLKEYHDLTFQEIANLQGCPLSTVKTRLYQGLSLLRRELQRRGVQGPATVSSMRAAAWMAKSSRKVVNLDR